MISFYKEFSSDTCSDAVAPAGIVKKPHKGISKASHQTLIFNMDIENSKIINKEENNG
jgi:hypothetical protein